MSADAENQVPEEGAPPNPANPPASAEPAAPGDSTPPAPEPSPPAEPGDAAPTIPAAPTTRPKMPWRRRLVFLGVGAVVAIGLAVGLFTQLGSSSSSGPPKAGDPVPTFSLPALSGTGRVGVPANGGGNGHPAILVFFASWCGPCHQEIPKLASIYARQQRAGGSLTSVRVIGIDGLDPTAHARAFVHQSGVTFPVGADRTYQVVSSDFGLPGLPVTVFVDGNGTIAGIHYGSLSPAAFTAWRHKLVS